MKILRGVSLGVKFHGVSAPWYQFWSSFDGPSRPNRCKTWLPLGFLDFGTPAKFFFVSYIYWASVPWKLICTSFGGPARPIRVKLSHCVLSCSVFLRAMTNQTMYIETLKMSESKIILQIQYHYNKIFFRKIRVHSQTIFTVMRVEAHEMSKLHRSCKSKLNKAVNHGGRGVKKG